MIISFLFLFCFLRFPCHDSHGLPFFVALFAFMLLVVPRLFYAFVTISSSSTSTTTTSTTTTAAATRITT